MILNVHVYDQTHAVEVSDQLLSEAESFFAKMDNDMSKGYQMSRRWVQSPDGYQRCQIAADKLVTALESANEAMQQMMAGYILSRMPGVYGVHINIEGDMTEHEFEVNQ